jgi:hypothetical protein
MLLERRQGLRRSGLDLRWVSFKSRHCPDGCPQASSAVLSAGIKYAARLSAGMFWKCPGCRMALHHSGAHRLAEGKVTYRCHGCHLDFVIDWKRGRWVVREGDKPGWRQKVQSAQDSPIRVIEG